MYITIFSRPFYPEIGGIEQLAMMLANEFISLGHKVEVVTDTLNINEDDKKFPFLITRTNTFYGRYDAFKRADVLLFMNFTFAGVPVAVAARKKIIISHHGSYDRVGSIKIILLEFIKRNITRFFYNISVSTYVKKNISGKSTVILNSYDDSLFKFSQKKRVKDFVFCGRLVSEKGCDILIESFKNILIDYPQSSLTIIGDGPESQSLQLKAKNIHMNVEFTGILSGIELANKLQEHACMVIPSRYAEPFGIVALEGIASCDTVIASNLGGLPEAIGGCGILIEPTIEDLTSVMRKFMLARNNAYFRLPGEPTLEQRNMHLKNHTRRHVALKYIEVLQKRFMCKYGRQ